MRGIEQDRRECQVVLDDEHEQVPPTRRGRVDLEAGRKRRRNDRAAVVTRGRPGRHSRPP